MQTCMSQKKDTHRDSGQPTNATIAAGNQGYQHSKDRYVKQHECGKPNLFGKRSEYWHNSPFVVGDSIQFVREKSRKSQVKKSVSHQLMRLNEGLLHALSHSVKQLLLF